MLPVVSVSVAVYCRKETDAPGAEGDHDEDGDRSQAESSGQVPSKCFTIGSVLTFFLCICLPFLRDWVSNVFVWNSCNNFFWRINSVFCMITFLRFYFD